MRVFRDEEFDNKSYYCIMICDEKPNSSLLSFENITILITEGEINFYIYIVYNIVLHKSKQ